MSSLASSHEDQVFPLLRLPPELRNRIYEYAFTVSDAIEVLPAYLTNPPDALRPELVLTTDPPKQPQNNLNGALLRTNKQIYDEALPACYALNAFRFRYPEYLIVFLSRINRLARNLISSIEVSAWITYCSFEAFGLIAKCGRLRSLTIHFHSEYLRAQREEMAKEIAAIRGLKSVLLTNMWCLISRQWNVVGTCRLDCKDCQMVEEFAEDAKREIMKPRLE